MSLPNPVTPAQFQAVVPQANASICDKLVNGLIKFPLLFYQWYSWAFDADGNWSTDAKANMGIATGVLLAPSSVAATDGTYTDHVVITWGSVSNATYYDVYRNTVDNSATATNIGTASATTFTDNASVAGYADDTQYYYWVKARNATDTSSFSASDPGRSDTSGGGGSGSSGTITFDASGTWEVPVGVTKIEVEAWGAGGTGGSGYGPWESPFDPYYGGGGGGSGQYRHSKQITVVPGNTLTVTISGTTSIRSPVATLLEAGWGLSGTQGGSGGVYNGAGGAGGSGGSTAGTAITTTSGNAGSAGALGGSPATSGAGGAGGAAISGNGAGGTGSGTGSGAGSAGGPGKLIITWPGAA